MSTPNTNFFDKKKDTNYDWRITIAQQNMITDKVKHLSKKEASLLINFMEHCIFNLRPSERQKRQEKLDDGV